MIGNGKLHFPRFPNGYGLFIGYFSIVRFAGRHGDGWWLPKHSIERTLHWDDDSWQEPQMLPFGLFRMRIECEFEDCLFCLWEGKRSWKVENLVSKLGVTLGFMSCFNWVLETLVAIPVIFSLGKCPSRCFTAHPVIFQFDTFLARVAATLTKGA